MTAPTLRHGLAVPFSLAAETFTFKLSGSSGTTRTVTISATSDVYVVLGDSTHDAVRILVAAMNAVMPGGVTVAGAMNSSGKVVLTLTGDTFNALNLFSSAIGATLGFTASVSAGSATVTADAQPKYLALFAEVTGVVWTPVAQNNYSTTAGGVSYGYQSGVLFWTAEPTFGFVPRDPAFTDADTLQTPFHPSDANLSSLGSHAVPWGVADCIAKAGGKTCHLALGNMQTLLTSTSAYYYNVSLAGQDLAQPRLQRQTGPWDKYLRWTVSMTRQSTPSGTRA